MTVFKTVKLLAEKTSDSIPQVMETVNNIDGIVKQTQKTIKDKMRYIPFVIAWLAVVSASIVGIFVCLLIQLLR